MFGTGTDTPASKWFCLQTGNAPVKVRQKLTLLFRVGHNGYFSEIVQAPTEVEVLDVSDYHPRKIPSSTWRECIRKVREIDPLACPKCGGEMKIISFITDAAIIRRILEHLGLWRGKRPKPAELASRTPPALDREKRYEPFDDGWPQYKEPFVAV